MTDIHEDWDDGFNDAIQCPHCGERDDEYTDYPRLEHDGETTECSCSNCGADFHVTMCVEYTWATKPLFIGPKINYAHRYKILAEMRKRGELPAPPSTERRVKVSYVTLKITKCGECPHHKVGPTYSLDGFDRGEDWTCAKTGKQIAGFVERPSEQPETIPDWCPLWAPKLKRKSGDK